MNGDIPRFLLAPPGVKDEARNLTPTAAFFIGCGLAEQLAARFSVPTTSLRVSVRTSGMLES